MNSTRNKYLFLIASFYIGLSAEDKPSEQPTPVTSETPVSETIKKDPPLPSKNEALANLVKEQKKKLIHGTPPLSKTIPVMEKPDNKAIEDAYLIKFRTLDELEKPQDRILKKIGKAHLVEARAIMGKYNNNNF